MEVANRQGDAVPVDGIVIDGNSSIDESMMTGESIPVEKRADDKVTGGTINKNGSLVIEAAHVGADTVLAQIIEMVSGAQRSRAPIQGLADKVSSILVPLVVGIAVLAFLAWMIFGPQPAIIYAMAAAVSVLNSMSTPWEVLEQLRDGILTLPHTARVVQAFIDLCAELRALDSLADIPALIDQLFPDGQHATRDIRQLALRLYAEDVGVERAGFVSKLVTAISQPEIPNQVDQVRIMSLHKSKGLSAPVTIVAGCVEGLLPRRPKDGLSVAERTEQLEEQRRLFFVGITRVKADPNNGKPGTLILTYSQEMPVADALGAGITPARQLYATAILQASRFIGELGPNAPAPILG